MTPKPRKKPAMTQAEKNGGRYAAEVAAAFRDGWEGRSAALTAWGKNEAVMVRKAQAKRHTYMDFHRNYNGEKIDGFLVLCDSDNCSSLASVILGMDMLCEEHAKQHDPAPVKSRIQKMNSS